MRALFFLALLTPIAAGLVGCKSDPDGPHMEYSSGIIVEQQLQDVWVATRSVLIGFGRGSTRFNEQRHEAQAVIDGEVVTVRIEEHETGRSILRVITDDTELAQTVLSAITALLPR